MLRVFLGYPTTKIIEEVRRRHDESLPTPERAFTLNSSGVVVVSDDSYIDDDGCVACKATPNDDGTITLTFND